MANITHPSPQLPPRPAPLADGGQPGAQFRATFGTWALFGRFLLVTICQLLVIPSPWAMTSFYRWLVSQLDIPYRKQVTFEGKPGDIWYIFINLAVAGLIGLIHFAVQFALTLLTAWLYLAILRWFFANLNWPGRREPLRFTGGYWPMLGWMALAAVSTLTIIGWAWVLTATTRWICRHVEGSSQQLSFVGSGWGVLWRTFLFALSCLLIIPIPWTLAWLSRWYVAQFCLSNRTALMASRAGF